MSWKEKEKDIKENPNTIVHEAEERNIRVNEEGE